MCTSAFSFISRQNSSDFVRFCIQSDCCSCCQNKQDGERRISSLRKKSGWVFANFLLSTLENVRFQRYKLFLRIVFFTSLSYCLRSGVCVGGRGYSNMKLVYICRTLFKNGGLKERPVTENVVRGEGVLSERPLTGKTEDLGVKNNKETYILFKTMVFSICPGRKNRTKNCIFLKKGGLLEWPTSKQ